MEPLAVGAATELRKRDQLARKVAGDRIVVDTVGLDSLALALAQVCITELGLDDQGRQTIARWAETWWQWRDGHHRPLEDEEVRARLWGLLRRIDLEVWNPRKEKREVRPLDPKTPTVSGVADAMTSICDRIGTTDEVPCALSGYDGPPSTGIAVVRNGLLELSTGKLYAPTPRLFATAGAAVDYDPDAECPTWETFLESIFADDDGVDRDTIRLVRQVFGWLLAGDTTRHTIPLVIGPPRSGKSTMMSILRSLLGEGNVCAPPLASLAESRFGLAPLLGKTAAIIPDARLGTRADQAAVAGLLLMVSGRDPVEIDRKGQKAINARLGCRLLIVTNELPRIADASGALSSRFLVISTRRSFLGHEDRGLEDRLRAELPGIMRWAIDGWKDLEAHGWTRPASNKEMLDELDRLGSPTKAFIADRLEVRPGAECTIDVLYREWEAWCREAGRREAGTVQNFARDLRAALPAGVKVSRPRTDGDRRTTMYVGLAVASTW